MRFYSTIFKIAAALLLLVGVHSVKAQNQTFSPYSRFGIGELNNSASVFQRLSLNSDISFISKQFANLSNKASISALSAPVFDVSFNYNRTFLENAQGKQTLSSGALGGFVIALPLKNGFGLSLSLAPVSSVGYRSTSLLSQDSITANVINEGSGGINSAQANGSYNFLNKKDSVFLGVTLGIAYTFGNINSSRSIEFSDQFFKNTRNTQVLSVSDLRYEIGLLYNKYINTNSNIGIGFVYTPSVKLNRSFSELSRNYTVNSLGNESFKDTVFFIEEKTGQITFPASINIGANYAYKEKLNFSVAVLNQTWSDFSQTVQGIESSFGNSNLTRVAFGVRYLPSTQFTFNQSVFQQTTYSLGFATSKGYVNVSDKDINTNALSLGLSMPVRRSNSSTYFHFGTEIGTRGDKDLILEKYVKVFFGLSISPKVIDRWFYKRKYN